MLVRSDIIHISSERADVEPHEERVHHSLQKQMLFLRVSLVAMEIYCTAEDVSHPPKITTDLADKHPTSAVEAEFPST